MTSFKAVFHKNLETEDFPEYDINHLIPEFYCWKIFRDECFGIKELEIVPKIESVKNTIQNRLDI